MNPSYARIQAPTAKALPRFSEWIGLSPSESPRTVPLLKAVDAACDQGRWRSQVAVFVFESGGWTIFNDLSGYLASISAERWKAFAGSDELIVAGYNDAVPYGQLIVVRDGNVIREFLDDRQDPAENVNRGELSTEKRTPIKDWIAAASFVDGDDLASPPESGLLCMFG